MSKPQDVNLPSVKELLSDFVEFSTSRKKLGEPRVLRVGEQIAASYNALPKQPSSFELKETEIKLKQACWSNDWSSIASSDWKKAPYVLFFEKPFLIEQENFMLNYFGWLHDHGLASHWRRLIFGYLKNFEYRHDYQSEFQTLSREIAWALQKPKLSERLRAWQQRHEKYGFFSPKFDLALSIFAFGQTPNFEFSSWTSETGLEGELSVKGFSEALGSAILQTPELAYSLDHILKYHLDGNSLRFGTQRVQFIEYLLRPWVKGSGKEPSVQAIVQTILLDLFGDPRVEDHRRNGWRDVGSTEREVVCRWLAGESLSRFFGVIDKVLAGRSENQWAYRRAFWNAYYSHELMTDAWVVFGNSGFEEAKRRYKGKLAAGRFDESIQQNVLLMRIGDIIFAESSHDGRCRAWVYGSPKAPRLYKELYSPSEFESKSLRIHSKEAEGISHRSPQTYWWQLKLRDYIRSETGEYINDNEFFI